MKITTYYVNAFTDESFTGNPAAVCVIDSELSVEIMQNIARDNNLPATVFLMRTNDGFDIRWFTPEYEINLCGHGTLAAGYVVFNVLEPSWESVSFNHPIASVLNVKRDDPYVVLDFPIYNYDVCHIDIEGFGIKPIKIYEYGKERLMAVFNSENDIKSINPDMELLKKREHRGIIVTAKGDQVDFVTRVFYPKKAITEDPVTGTAFCLLVPYWAARLGKTSFLAHQLSDRGGTVKCELGNDKVKIFGQAYACN